MKVMHLFNEIRFSGAETMYANAASTFRELGISMLAISSGPELGDYAPIFEQNGISCMHLPAKYGHNLVKALRYAVALHHLIRQESVQALHIHRNDLYLPGVVAWFAGIKCVKTQHNTFKNRWFTRPYAILKRNLIRTLFSVQFHTIGESVYQNELDYYKNPSIRINNWYDEKQFFPANSLDEKQRLRESLNVPLDAFVLISVGSCTHVKNHHDILRAMPLTTRIKALHYVHLGAGKTEVEEQDLAKSLGIIEKTSFHGNCKNIRDYLVASDVFIMPSVFEGLGNSALEAMACGIPTILYDSPGLRDLIHNNDTGSLVTCRFESITKAIVEYYENSSLTQEKIRNALTMVLNEYSMKANVPGIAKLYEK